jgi:hypothetical protein
MSETDRIKSQDFDVLDEEIKMQKKIARDILESKNPLKILCTWEAPERYFEKKDTRWFVIVAGIALAIIILAALTNNFILIFAIISLVIVVYALYTIPPRIVEHQVTNKGIYTINTLHLWNSISYFWVSRRGKMFIFNIEYKKKMSDAYYQRMILLAEEKDYKKVATLMSDYVVYLGPENISKNAISVFADGVYVPIFDIIENLEEKKPIDKSK